MRRPLVDVHSELTAWRRTLWGLLPCALLLLPARPAQAAAPLSEHCSASAQRYIAMQTPPPSADELVPWSDVIRHVGSELSLRQVELCTTPKAQRPLARLQLDREGPSSVRIRLWGASPRAPLGERTLELGPVPQDARLLAIAVATDELLAANLSELEHQADVARAPAAPGPRIVTPEPAPPRFELGPGFVYESFAGGQALLGVDARLGLRVVSGFGLTLRLGLRQGLPEQADHGSLHATALLGGLGLRFSVLQGKRLELDVLGRADALRLSVSAYPAAGSEAHDVQGVALVLSAGPGLRIALSRSLSLLLEGSGGGAVRPVYFTDTGRRVSGASGLALALGGGVLASF